MPLSTIFHLKKIALMPYRITVNLKI